MSEETEVPFRLRERAVLEKWDQETDPPTLIEKITLVDGVIVSRTTDEGG